MISNDSFAGLVNRDESGHNHLALLVSGVHCAACIQKIEATIAHNDNVRHARLNFSTGRLNITWDGAVEQVDEMVRQVRALGYGVNAYNPDVEKTTAEAENRFLLLCLGAAGFAMGNIMLLSVGLWTTDTETMGSATRDLLHWVSALIGIPAVAFCGRPFFFSAFAALKNRTTNMDVPISVGLFGASAMSLFETITHGEHVYFDSAVMLMFFLLIGRYLDFRARRNARAAATSLMQTLSGTATVIDDDNKTRRVLIRDVRAGMQVLVAAGENFPVDGTVIDGESSVDTSLVTGETLPCPVEVGSAVYAGTLNQEAALRVLVEKASDQSLLADVIRLMEKAEQGQARYVRLADRAAKLYTPVVHAFGAAAFIMWWGFLDMAWQDALMIGITVLIITCPCALGLAVPVVQVLASGLLLKRGIMVKSGDALERLASIDTIFFDKTGTLTMGKPSLLPPFDSQHLQLGASLASHSRHPLSKALVIAYGDAPLLPVTNVDEVAGKGLQGVYDGKTVKLGSAEWCGISAPADDDRTQIWLDISGQEPIAFSFHDTLRADAAAIIGQLQKQDGIECWLLSGDRQSVVDLAARMVGITHAYSLQTPVDKYQCLEQMTAQGHKVLMVGDGLNDAPVLAGAHVSIAPGSAIDMAKNAADIIFMGDKLEPVTYVRHIALWSQKLVRQNFALAIGYNVIAIPLAFAGYVTPMLAALAMSGSSLVVIANSFRLRFIK